MKSSRAEALLLALLLGVAGGCAEDVSLAPPSAETSLSQAAQPLGAARLLKDINSSRVLYEDRDASPAGYTQAGSLTYFVASPMETGAELWRTDGTEAGTVLVKDLYPGPGSSAPTALTAVGSTLFFVARTPASGAELWKTDGTEAGTVLVKEFIPGIASGYFGAFAAVGSTLFFTAEGTGTGSELWKSDGTTAGTVLVKDIYVGSSSSSPASLTAMGGTLYFSASASDGTGRELWKSDGTAAGTVRVMDIYAGSASSAPVNLFAVGGTLYFRASHGSYGYELWKTDGTPAGTVLVKDLHPGTASSNPGAFVEAGGIVFFTAIEAATGTELWRTDGTAAGTFLVRDIHPGTASASPAELEAVGGVLFFTAQEPGTGRELWRSDGTAAGTFLVADLRPGSTSSTLAELTGFNGRLYFRDSWNILFTSDGTEAGTARVGSSASDVRALAVAGQRLMFTNEDVFTGSEPWTSDGTAAGTKRLRDLQPNLPPSRPGQFIRVGDKVFFRARTTATTFGVFQTDGTEAGTTAVGDPLQYGNWEPTALAAVNGTVFFEGDDYYLADELWKTDGTGAWLVKNIHTGNFNGSAPMELTAMGHALYFTAFDATGGREVWKSDGTEAGTVRLRDIAPGATSSSPRELVVMNGALYFNAGDSAAGSELWKSDGTEAGTVRVKDLYPGANSSYPTKLTVVGNTLYFAANTSGMGNELWKSDGTEAGTVLLKDINPGFDGSYPSEFTAVGNTVFFQATDAAGGYELWKSDGTPAGTVRVRDIYPGMGGAYPRFLTGVNQRLFFGAGTPNEGYELWTSDGTEAGTVLVRDALPGPDSGLSAEPMLGLGPEGLVLFTATDGTSGMEPWVSDGTAASTRQLVDVFPGARSSAPGSYFRAGSLVYFAADDGVHGREPWVYSLEGFRDTTPPTVTCPGEVVAEATDRSGALVSYPPATATDDNLSGPPTLAYSHPSGGRFPPGINPVTVTATDVAGNSSTCTFLVRVRDTTAPTITCPVDVTAEATGPHGAPVSYPPATAADTASSPGLSYSLPAGGTFPLGATTVTATATDDAGLSASCTFQVRVVDTTAPTLACPANVVAGATGPAGATVTYPAAIASDAVTFAPPVAYSRASGSSFPLGSTPVTVTAVDAAGNRTHCGFTVTVQDATLPTLACPAPVFVEATSAAGAVVRYAPATVSGALSRVSLSYSRASGSSFPLGSTPVTVTATTSAGSTVTCSFTVSVQDTLAPRLSCPAGVAAEATQATGAQVTYPSATASDASGTVTLAYSQPSGTVFPLGVNRVSVTATDGSGNSASCAFTVSVRDTLPPTLTCPFNVTAEALDPRGVSVTYPPAVVTDAVSALTSTVYSKDSGSSFLPGQTRVTVMATDESGNAATCNFYVTVRDTRPPVLSCPAPAFAEATGSTGAPVHYAAAIATDAMTLSPSITYSPAAGSTFPLGTTVVTASATDAAGNAATCTFPVTVRDTHAPALSCPPDVSFQATSSSGAQVTYGPTYQPPTASDGISTATVTYSRPPTGSFPMGTTPVTATATDGAGNPSACTWHVTVRDTAAPALTCPANVVAEATEPGGAWVTYAPPTVSDLSSATVSASPAPGTLFPVGVTAVTVVATDGVGNSALCTFTVQVRDTTPPALTCPADVVTDATSPSGASVLYPEATTSDVVTALPHVSYSHASGTVFPTGNTTLNAVARDEAGNASTCTFDIVVRPTTVSNRAPSTTTLPGAQMNPAASPQ
jgi:ELWxxDGT repeat protein